MGHQKRSDKKAKGKTKKKDAKSSKKAAKKSTKKPSKKTSKASPAAPVFALRKIKHTAQERERLAKDVEKFRKELKKPKGKCRPKITALMAESHFGAVAEQAERDLELLRGQRGMMLQTMKAANRVAFAEDSWFDEETEGDYEAAVARDKRDGQPTRLNVALANKYFFLLLTGRRVETARGCLNVASRTALEWKRWGREYQQDKQAFVSRAICVLFDYAETLGRWMLLGDLEQLAAYGDPSEAYVSRSYLLKSRAWRDDDKYGGSEDSYNPDESFL